MAAAQPPTSIPFNKPHLTGGELACVDQAIRSGKLSGNGAFTKRCQEFFERRYGFKKCLLTTSCTDALEMCAILAGVGEGDEVIVPGYTFVSTALAFVRQGAKIVFVDSRADHPNIDADAIEPLITPRTKAIALVHYAGVACDMDAITKIAERHGLIVIEDAAQAVDSFYTGADGTPRAIGSIGHLAAFSFHDTKNITCGEGGMIAVNDDRFIARSEIVWEKGTNRADFFRGNVSKYGWVDTGSSFLPSEITAAFLWAQLERIDEIQAARKAAWEAYFEAFKPLADKGLFQLHAIPPYATNNAHTFYIVCNKPSDRTGLIEHLKCQGIGAVFHYQSLHRSDYYKERHDGRELKNCDRYSDCLVRLPLYYGIGKEEVERVRDAVASAPK
jgi:dTDP-4-amino-4,6-dideoxygalactose transaminase